MSHLIPFSTVSVLGSRQICVYMIDYNSRHEPSYTLHDLSVLNMCVSRKDMAWLESESGRQQFLTWLVRGAIRWYQSGRTLGALPAKL